MRLIRREVIINTKSDKAFRGVLWSRWFGVYVLKQAQLLAKGSVVDIDGEVVILKQDIDFIQVVPL